MTVDLPGEFYLVLTVFLGLVFGSFATALAYRLPRGLSILKKSRSACPSCDRKLGVLDLVPVFSWLFLRGKCRSCKAAIGWQYPAIELVTLALCLVFYWRFGLGLQTLCFFALAPVVVSIVAIDFAHKIIPDGLNLAVAALALAGLAGNALLAADLRVRSGGNYDSAGLEKNARRGGVSLRSCAADGLCLHAFVARTRIYRYITAYFIDYVNA